MKVKQHPIWGAVLLFFRKTDKIIGTDLIKLTKLNEIVNF